MNPLLRTTPLRGGETILSFASRLAAANGIRTLREFLHDMRLDSSALAWGDDEEVSRLAALGGLEPAAMLASGIVRVAPDYEVSGQKVQKGFMARNAFRICPACIADDIERGEGPPETRPYLRSAWSVSLVRTCPRHLTPLLVPAIETHGHVPQDVAAITRDARSRILGLAGNLETIAESGLENYIRDRFAGADGKEGFLSSLPFYAAVRLTEMIGGMVLFGKNFSAGTLSPGDWLDAGREGYAFTSTGEDGVRDFLSSSYGSFLASRRNVGGRVLFGSLHTWLLQSSKNADFDSVRALVRNHVVDTLPVGPGDEILGAVDRRRWHSIHSAAGEYGIHPKRLRKLLREAGHIKQDDMELSDGRVVFDAAAADGFLRSVTASLTGEDARKYVNASRVQWDILTRERIIEPTIPAGGSSQAAYSRASLDDFLTAVAYSTGPRDGRLRHPSTAARSARCTLVEIVRMLMDRKLDEVAISNLHQGFQAVLVNPAEVREKLPKKETAGLSMNQATKRMGLHGNLVRRLVVTGSLPSTLMPVQSPGRPVRVIKPEDADAFVELYVTLTELAGTMNLGNCGRVARKIIEEKGVRPAFDPDVVGARIYERANGLESLHAVRREASSSVRSKRPTQS